MRVCGKNSIPLSLWQSLNFRILKKGFYEFYFYVTFNNEERKLLMYCRVSEPRL